MNGYVINPTLGFEAILKLRKKNSPLVNVNLCESTSLDVRARERLINLCLDLKAGRLGGDQTVSQDDITLLLDWGVLVPEDQIPQSVEYRCELSIDKDFTHYIRKLGFRDDNLKLNPTLVHQALPYSRLDVADLPRPSCFRGDEEILWVKSLGTEMWWPYWIDDEMLTHIKSMKLGMAPRNLPEDVLSSFVLAEIVIPDQCSEKRKDWAGKILDARDLLKINQYVVLSGLVPELHLSALRRYCRKLESEGFLRTERGIRRLAKYNEPILQFIHRQTGRLVRRITEEPLIPSFCYLSAYLKNAVLPKHTDRPQCKLNGSLLLDIQEVQSEEGWPLFLEIEGRSKAIMLGLGDIVFYCGTEVPHWRETLSNSGRQTLGLFHYVPMDFVGGLR